MITDATDNSVNPSAKSNIETISIDHIANVDPLRDPQTQPRVLARQVPSSTARGQMQLGSPNIFTDSGNRRIMVQDDSQVNVVEIGNIGLNSAGAQLWGMKVAQPGFDVTTATNSQLIFNSQQNVFKIVDSGAMIITTTAVPVGSSGSDSQTYVHNLGFIPSFVYYVQTSTGNIYDPSSFGSLTGVSGANQYIGFIDNMNAGANSTEFVITIYQSSFYWGANPGGNANIAETFTFKFFLLQETATPSSSEHGSIL